MKKLFFTLLTLSLLFTVMFFLFTPKETKKHQSAIALKEKDTKSKETPVDKIVETSLRALTLNPSTLSEKQFYEYAESIIAGFSGSGGNFLGTNEINWILKGEDAFNKRGIKLKDREYRHSVIAWSYFSGANEQYDKALEEFKSIKDQYGIELSEWVINNKRIKNGIVKIKEYEGIIPCDASENAKIENDRYRFVAYFKGPVYRYDKLKNLHALIFKPASQYDWYDELKLENEKLIIGSSDNADTFILNNITHKLARLDKKVNVASVK